MIEKMKKVSVLVKNRELTPSLNILRKSGVMHVSGSGSKRSEEIERDEQLIAMFQQVISSIELNSDKKNKKTVSSGSEFKNKEKSLNYVIRRCRDIDTLLSKRNEKKEYIQELNILIDRLYCWGNFNPADIEYLHGCGIKILPAEMPLKSLSSLEKKFSYILVKRTKKFAYIVFLDAREDQLPEYVNILKYTGKSLDMLQKEIAVSEKRIERINTEIADEYRNILVYRDVQCIIESEYRLKAVQENMDSDGPVSWVTGFIPERDVSALKITASEHAWGLVIDDPSIDDNIPTKLKNNWLVRIIKPVFTLLGTIPGYREYDVSTFFLLFFTLFCAMIIGDAGYGAIFFIGAVILHIKTRKGGELVRLLYVLSITTIVWGAITGTWFGSEKIVNIPFFRQFVIQEISSFPELFNMTTKDVSEMVMYICFILGIVQLSLACIINFIRQLPRLKAVAQIGWLGLLIGLYTLVLNLVLGKPFPVWGMYSIIGGLAFIIIFGEQQKSKNFFSGLLKGFAGLFTTFLDSISAFSNIISYIRLFAVGMSSVAIASSFNSMASGFSGGIAIVGALVILLIGHGLNIVMGLLSVIVHGVRLNMLEFSGQLGMEWSGIAYDPLKEHSSTYFTDFYDRT